MISTLRPTRLLCVFFLSILLGAGVVAGAESLRLGSVQWPPFSGEGDQPRVAIALVQEALYRIGRAGETTLVEDGTLTPALQEGRFDGSPAMWRTAEREEFLYFSRPILENRLVLVGRKGADVSPRMLSELEGQKVGVVAGYAYGEAVSGVEGPVFVVGRDQNQNLERLLAGEVDYALVDELLIHYVSERQASEVAEHLEIGTVPMVKRNLHFAVRKDVERVEELLRDFDAELQKMLTDGTYNRLLGLNWIRADADGDGQLELILGSEGAGKEAPVRGYQITSTGSVQAGGVEFGKDRYFIDGKVVEGWGQVPERYKAYDPTWPDMANTSGTLLRFNFKD